MAKFRLRLRTIPGAAESGRRIQQLICEALSRINAQTTANAAHEQSSEELDAIEQDPERALNSAIVPADATSLSRTTEVRNSSAADASMPLASGPTAESISATAVPATADSPSAPPVSTHAASLEAGGVSNAGSVVLPPGLDDDEAPPEYDEDTVMHVSEALVEHAWSFLFSNVKAVLDGLTMSGGCIGGSRALNMFVPDSCTQLSDIDVYSAWNVHSVARILRSFSSAGVVWHTANVEDRRALNCSVEQYSRKDLTIIRGHTTHNDSNIPVQLIFKKDMSPIQHIMTYYSSHVQCALTGVGAFHLYHTLAMQKKGLIWPGNIENQASVNRGMLKYTRRGWQLEWSPRSLENRSIKAKEPGSGARVILFQRQEGDAGEDHPAVTAELRNLRTAAMINLAWSQVDGSTTYTSRYCPEVYHNEQVEAYLNEIHEHGALQENREEQYISDLRLVRQYTTAFDVATEMPEVEMGL